MRDDPTSVMLFAAGFGTRMGALTQHRPKPLIKVAGTTLLDHSLVLAQNIAPKQIVVNTHYLAEQIEQHLSGQKVMLIHETPDILETGGGLRNALPLLGDGPVYTSNTDAIWKGPNPFQCLKAVWNPDQMDALLLCVPRDNAHGHKGAGDFDIDASGRLHRKGPFIYGGVQIIKTELLKGIQETAFSLNLLWNMMDARGRLFGTAYPGQWCDVGQPDSITLAEDLLGEADV